MRYLILALVASGHAHGYDLKQAIDDRFGSVGPPINVGQIYTTLSRLERDGLVESREIAQSDRPNKRVYDVTDEGQKALEDWVREPVRRNKSRDDFFVKLIMAELTGMASAAELIEQQRGHHLQAIRDLEVSASSSEADSESQLLIEGAVLHLQADLRWLDLCESHFTDSGGTS